MLTKSIPLAALILVVLATCLWVPAVEETARAVPGQDQGQDNRNWGRSDQNLSGRYSGYVQYPAEDLDGSAMLVIEGERFELSTGSIQLTGEILTNVRGEPMSVVLRLGGREIQLRAFREGRNFWLYDPQSTSGFYFGTSRRYPPGVRGPEWRSSANVGPDPKPRASIGVTNTNTIPRNANTIANTSAPNANSNQSEPVRDGWPRPRPSVRATAPANTENINATARATPNSNSSVSSQLRGPANVGFQVPETMRLDETKAIELAVSPTDSVESLIGSFTEIGRAEGAKTQYSDKMEAKLVGSGFIITPAGPDIQPVEPGQKTYWKWQIKPKTAGIQRLDLTLNAIVNDGKDRKLITALKREIQINVTWGQRASSLLGAAKDIHWLWGALILPIGGAIYAWWRKRGSNRLQEEKIEN